MSPDRLDAYRFYQLKALHFLTPKKYFLTIFPINYRINRIKLFWSFSSSLETQTEEI